MKGADPMRQRRSRGGGEDVRRVADVADVVDRAQAVWHDLADAVAQRLVKMDTANPTDMQIVTTVLLGMAARAAVVGGVEELSFAQAAQRAFVRTAEITSLEDVATQADARSHWMMSPDLSGWRQ